MYLKPFLIYDYIERKDDIRIAKKELHRKEKARHASMEKLFDDSVRVRRVSNDKKISLDTDDDWKPEIHIKEGPHEGESIG